MTYHEAFGAIIIGFMLLGFGAWYLWCLYTMFVRCARPREFFCEAYSTSGPFLFVNGLAAVAGAAWVLMWLTN